MRVLDYPPISPSNIKGLPIFFKDEEYDFARTFFVGLELEILLFGIITFNFFNYLTGSSSTAILITYVFEKTVEFLRDYFGKKNIARKTMIDEKFLIWLVCVSFKWIHFYAFTLSKYITIITFACFDD